MQRTGCRPLTSPWVDPATPGAILQHSGASCLVVTTTCRMQLPVAAICCLWLQHSACVATTDLPVLQSRICLCCNLGYVATEHVASTGDTLQEMRIEREMQRLREMEYEFALQGQQTI